MDKCAIIFNCAVEIKMYADEVVKYKCLNAFVNIIFQSAACISHTDRKFIFI